MPLDPIIQDSDLLDFKLDAVAMFEVPAELKPAAIADVARADELAGHQILAGLDGLGHWVLLSARAFRSADLFAGVILLGVTG